MQNFIEMIIMLFGFVIALGIFGFFLGIGGSIAVFTMRWITG